MDFPGAMQKVIEGKTVRRAAWDESDWLNDDGQFLRKYTPGWNGAYVVEHDDLHASDWEFF